MLKVLLIINLPNVIADEINDKLDKLFNDLKISKNKSSLEIEQKF